jgi:hypothetical protein
VQGAVHRALVGDLEQAGALLGRQLTFQHDLAVDVVELSIAHAVFGAFADRLIELGRSDTRARADEIRAFFTG